MTLPVSASASCSISTISSALSSSPVTARTSSRLLLSGKISSACPEKRPVEILAHGDEVRDLAFADQSRRTVLRDDVDRGYRQMDLVAHHLAQARGRAADSDIDDLGQRVAFKLGKRDVVGSHPFRDRRRSAAPEMKPSSPSGGDRFGDERGIDGARARDDLVLDVGGDDRDRQVGIGCAQFAGERQPVLLGHVEVDQRDVDRLRTDDLERLSGAARLDALPRRLQFGQRLSGDDPRELAVVHDENRYRHMILPGPPGRASTDFRSFFID